MACEDEPVDDEVTSTARSWGNGRTALDPFTLSSTFMPCAVGSGVERAPAMLRQAGLNLPCRSVSRLKHKRPDSKVAALVRYGVVVMGRDEHLRSGQLGRLLAGVAVCMHRRDDQTIFVTALP